MGLIQDHIVDWWTLYHFLGWSVLGAVTVYVWRPSFWMALLFGLVCGLSWEVVEMQLEWFLHFEEPFWNRWGSDPLTDVLGTAAGWFMARKTIRYGLIR